MTLDEFVAKHKEDLDKFEKMWREEHQRRPDDFPMDVGNQTDWLEQLDSWLGM